MTKSNLDKVKRECGHESCGGRLTYWMAGTASDLYYCEGCGTVHRWDGRTLVMHNEWVVPFTFKFGKEVVHND